MATFSERLAYILDFNTQGAIRDVEKFGKAAEKNLGDADKRIDKLGRNMQKFGAGAVAFAGVAGVGLLKLASGAADAEANMSALTQVVGEAIAKDIAKWAEKSAKNVGLSSKAAVAATTQFAQLGKFVGLTGGELQKFSTDLVELSADFAAFHNVSPEQMLQDIQSAFAGSTEVMRKYGIFLDDATLKQAYFRETGEKITGTMTSQQKVVAINAELYRQGADAIGQWGRESDTLVGQQAQLKANLENLADSIGAGVLPMVEKLATAANTVAEWFNKLSPGARNTIGTIAAVGTAAIGAAGALSFVIGKVITARDRFQQLGSALGRLKGSMPTAASAAPMVAFTAIVVKAFLDIQERAKEAEEQVDRLVDGMGELGSPLKAVTAELNAVAEGNELFAASLAKAGLTTEEVARAALQGGDAWEAMAAKIRDAGDDIEGSISVEEFNELERILGKLPDRARTAIEHYKNLDQVQSDVAASAKDAAEGTDAAADATRAATDATIPYVDWLIQRGSAEGRASENAYRLETAARAAAEATNQLTAEEIAAYTAANQLATALNILFGQEISIEQATLNHLNAVQALTDQVTQAKEDSDQYATSLDLMTETGRRNREAVLQQVGAIEQYADTMRDGGASNDEVRGKVTEMVGQLRNQMLMLGFTESEVDSYIATLKLTPEDITTRMHVRSDEALRRIEAVKQRLASVKDKTVTLTVKTFGGGTSTTFGAFTPGTSQQRHSGGPVEKGVPYIVGKTGAEELFVPDESGQVIPFPNGRAQPVAAAAPVQQTFNISQHFPAGTRPEQVYAAMRRWGKLQGPL